MKNGSGARISTVLCVVKTDLLQFEQRAAGAGDQNDAIHEMIGQFRRERGVRELVGVDAGFDEGGGLFPNRIVTGHENNAAPHQRRYGTVIVGEGPRRILVVRGISRRFVPLDDQRIGL